MKPGANNLEFTNNPEQILRLNLKKDLNFAKRVWNIIMVCKGRTNSQVKRLFH